MKAIDRVYQDEANRRIPIVRAYTVAVVRLNGAPEAKVNEMLENWRKWYADFK